MHTHMTRPRIVEACLTLLSNLAYAGDGVRSLIAGEDRAGALLAQALALFSGDKRTFDMALRALGNLARADRAIVDAVAGGRGAEHH